MTPVGAPVVFDKVQDSGKREEFVTGSRRDTNAGKPRFDLIPPIPLFRTAMHFTNGSVKYGDDNWSKGQPLRRYIESLERHLWAVKMGYTDEDHEAAVIWNMMAYMHTKVMIQNGSLPQELDNMPKYSDEIRALFKKI